MQEKNIRKNSEEPTTTMQLTTVTQKQVFKATDPA